MARIRSIKPDFFTSETIGRLTKSARLTFIGLWTHVDDNGICVMNEMLICAALYPLDDPMDSLFDLQEDLRRITGEGLVTIYKVAGKRYLFVNSWDEHQKISHPGKARYPRPSADGCEDLTSDYMVALETFRKVAGERREGLRPEQGAGSREQGSNSSPSTDSITTDSTVREDETTAAATAGETLFESTAETIKKPRRKAGSSTTGDQDFERFYAAYPRRVNIDDAEKAWVKAVKIASADEIVEGVERFKNAPEGRKQPDYLPYPATWLNGKRWKENPVGVPASTRRPHDNPWDN